MVPEVGTTVAESGWIIPSCCSAPRPACTRCRTSAATASSHHAAGQRHDRARRVPGASLTYDREGQLIGAPHFAQKPCLGLSAISSRTGTACCSRGRAPPTLTLPACRLRRSWISPATSRPCADPRVQLQLEDLHRGVLEDYHVAPFHPGLGKFVTCDDLSWQFGDWYSVQQVGITRSPPGSPTYARWHKAVQDYYGERNRAWRDLAYLLPQHHGGVVSARAGGEHA